MEDNLQTASIVARLVKKRGFDVLSAATVEAALKLAEVQPIRFVICDIGLPDGTGYELLSALKERHGTMGVAITGYGMEADVARARSAGFIMHLTKPIGIEQLETILALAAPVLDAAHDSAGTSVNEHRV